MSRPAQAKLKPVVEGDTWDGIALAYSSTGTALGSSLSLVEMTFSNPAGEIGLALSSATAAITIGSALLWQFTVAPREMTLSAGTWHWSVKTTDAQAVEKTYLMGTIQVLAV